jgi:hypothetical protein
MGTIKQLAEIAALVIFQEWSALKNNQRLDFFVLLYQDKRTTQRASSVVEMRFSEDSHIIRHITFYLFKVKKTRNK